MKILLVYLQPKDIPEVLEPLKDIFVDKIYLKYMKYPEVYEVALKFIKNHTEYTHIFWLQNDIVLNNSDFEKAVTRIHENNILGLSMFVEMENFKDMAYTIEPFKITEQKYEWAIHGTKGIIQVFHNGGPFICKREFYLKYPLTGDFQGYNADYYHGFEMWRNNEPYYLISDANLSHLRFKGEMQVHKKTPHLEFIRI